ncbi:putative reverse transcriptase domain-containing protein, partial [Tanacetum coccineum]
DPNVVTDTYSLNNLYANVLFDSGNDFSFISTKFAPLLNEKPSIANPGYVIEVANGKKEEVNRIFRGCRLELGDSIFPIDLIPLRQGSFDVIVGMDWLSNQKAVIVCHEKVVRIPVEEGKIVRDFCEAFVDLKLAIRQDLGFIPSGNVVLSSTYVGKILGADQLLVILCYRYQESGIGYWILSMTISGSGVSTMRLGEVDKRDWELEVYMCMFSNV